MNSKNRRKYDRYETEVQIYFHVGYDLETKVEFEVLDENKKKTSEKYSATSKNVSADGMSFVSDQQLKKDDPLRIEVYLPKAKSPIHMQGEVRWSQQITKEQIEQNQYETGVQLKTINGESVVDSIHFDEEHKVMWSAVLQSVFDNFKKLAQNDNDTNS